MSVAEKHGVIIQMELLNSKVDHADYMCDKSAWGIELCKRVGSPNLKLLYDIYHMQIMEGDVIATIRRPPAAPIREVSAIAVRRAIDYDDSDAAI